MSENKEKTETSEIQLKQYIGNYNLILKNIINNEISTISFILTDGNNENLMSLELDAANFELFVKSLKKFATIIKETDSGSALPSHHRPMDPHQTFSEYHPNQQKLNNCLML